MPIETKRVIGRRNVRYESLDEFLGEAERMANSDVTLLGNWSLGQIFRHLAYAITGSACGFTWRMPLPAIWVTRLIVKKNLLANGIKPGFRFFGFRRADVVWPGETTTAEGLALLREAITRFKQEPTRHPHPILGRMRADEWDQFHLRHAELHMSFVVPKS